MERATRFAIGLLLYAVARDTATADFTRRHAELNPMRITIAAAFVLSSILSVFGTSQDDVFQLLGENLPPSLGEFLRSPSH